MPTEYKKGHHNQASRIEALKGPIDAINVGQMETIVLAHFVIDQSVELVVHGEQDILLCFVQGEIVRFIRIVFEVEQLNIVDFENLLNCRWTVVVQGTKISAVFVPCVIHGANGRALSGGWIRGPGRCGEYWDSGRPRGVLCVPG